MDGLTVSPAQPAVWHFPEGLVGYPEWRRFELAVVHQRPLVGLLRSYDVPGLELVVVDPRDWLPEYAFEVAEADLALLQAVTKEDLTPLVIADATGEPPQVTLNLLGPLVLNPRARLGRQVVQSGRDYSPAHPLATGGTALTFPAGLVGFPEWRHFLLQRRSPEDPVAALVSLDEPGLSLLVVDPWLVAPDYAPQPAPEDLEALGVADPRELTWLCVLDVPSEDSLEGATANLLGPLAVHLPSGRGRQVVLARSAYSARHPLDGLAGERRGG